MNQESTRIFVGNLPANTTEDEITNNFSSYGNITSIQIKSKSDASDNITHFAFVSLNIDHHSLQKCLQNISSNEWRKGHYVNIQMAKESFLERLKREREEANAVANKQSNNSVSVSCNKVSNTAIETPKLRNNFTTNKTKAVKIEDSSSSSSSESDDDSDNEKSKISPKTNVEEEDLTDFVIKSNKGKKLNGGCLKIESFGKEPIYVSEIKKPKSKDPKRSEADEKRKKSMMEMRKGYQQQKSMIKNALSNLDVKPVTTHVSLDSFSTTLKRKSNDHTDAEPNKKSSTQENKLSLFDEDEEQEEGTFNFSVNEELSGKKGKKLMELQSKYNNDKRFAMDSRFLEDEEDEEQSNRNEDVEITLEDEKKRQYEILGSVLGTPFQPSTSMGKKDLNTSKSMLRFDPNAPEHSKYELERIHKEKSKRGKEKDKVAKDKLTEQTTAKPEVSQEQFYQVNENLKQSLQEKQAGFSLLNLYGRSNGEEKTDEQVQMPRQSETKMTSAATLRYDSSDEEAINEDINPETKQMKPVSWNESFFFVDEDERFQEGLQFMKKLGGSGVDSEFKKLRQNLKEIVRTKVRHNQRKNKQFKKKLGGKKMIKLKKAMKR